MANPKLDTTKADKVRALLSAFPEWNLDKIAKIAGVSQGTVSNIKDSRHHIASDKKGGEFDWEEWCEWIDKGQKLRKKASFSQEDATISLGDGTKPQILFQLGDTHIGSWGTDHNILRQLTKEIRDTPGVNVALMGDLIEMAIKMRSVLEVTSQIIPPEGQLDFLESWLNQIWDKVVFSVWCNHGVEREERMSGISSIKRLLSRKTVYFNGIGHPDIKVGKQTYHFAVSHKFRGNSMYDSTHGPKRYARMEAADREIILQGDLHRPGVSIYYEGGHKRIAITNGSLHLNSGYAKRYFSLKTLPIFPCLVLHHDEHKAVPFWNLAEALKYIG